MKDILFEKRGIHYQFNDFEHGRPTLLFIHGLSGSSSAWHQFEEHLTHRFNLLMIDLRGHGRSVKYRRYRDYGLKQLAEDVHELVEHLRIEDFTLVSHSFGTLVALEYLIDHRHKARAAILLSPNYGVHRTRRARISWPFLAVLACIVDVLPAWRRQGRRLDYATYIGTGDWNIRRMAADIYNTSLRVYIYCLEHAYKFNRDSWWARVGVPTLIVHGRKDLVIPVQSAEKMASEIRGAELVLLENADHTLVLNAVDEVVPLIRKFVLA